MQNFGDYCIAAPTFFEIRLTPEPAKPVPPLKKKELVINNIKSSIHNESFTL